jgi:hypothetical protein
LQLPSASWRDVKPHEQLKMDLEPVVVVAYPVVVFVRFTMMPAGHGVHTDWPTVWANVPWGQGVHTVTPEDEV